MNFEQRKEEKVEPISDPETLETLSRIDFKVLRAIFAEHARRSGVDPNTLGFQDRDDVGEGGLTHAILGVGGTYSVEKEQLTINSRIARILSFLDQEQDKNAVILSLLCHEETHASSHRNVTEHQEDILFGVFQKRIKELQTGVRRTQIITVGVFHEYRRYYDWFNEGITDELGNEVFTEYQKRNPLLSLSSERTMEYVSGYPLARLFVRTLCERIAEEANVPYDIVWKSFIRMYMRGDDLENGELRQVFDEIFSESFIAQLSEVRETTNPVNMLPLGKQTYDAINISVLFARVITQKIARRLYRQLEAQVQKQFKT